MRFKLSYKIFVILILTSLLVVTLMVGLIRVYAARNFADYVNRSLLERYSQFADALIAEYQLHKGWQVLKNNPERWQEILRASLPRKDFNPDNFSPQPPEFENKITIENNLENHPPITIIGDADRLRQLFSNLVENTLRYADAPGILRIEQECIANRLILFFEDSGPGVPQDVLDRLFDRLYRVDRSRSRAQGGSGLGLSICKSIVNALGGEIRATNGNLGC